MIENLESGGEFRDLVRKEAAQKERCGEAEEIGEDFAHHGEMDIADHKIGGTGADGVGRTLPNMGVLPGQFDGGRLHITGPDRGGAQCPGGGAEDSGAGPNVENGLAGAEDLFKEFEAQLCGLMFTTTKNVGSDHGEAEPAGRGGIVAIGRAKEKTLANQEGLPVIPPDVTLLGRRFDRGGVGGGESFSCDG